MPGLWLSDCWCTCKSKTKGEVCKATYRPNKMTPTPCQGQFYIVRAPEFRKIKAPGTKLKRMREKESRIIDQILDRKLVANEWTLQLRGGDTVTVKRSMLLGYNWPLVGKYFVPCNMICTNRDGLCTKVRGSDRVECQQQFFYVKSQIKVNAELQLRAKEK